MMRCLVLLLALAFGAACNNGPSEEQCTLLLEHLIDLEFKKAGATATGDTQKADLAKQKETVVKAKSEAFLAECTKKTARSRVECALSASDLEAVGRCDNDESDESGK